MRSRALAGKTGHPHEVSPAVLSVGVRGRPPGVPTGLTGRVSAPEDERDANQHRDGLRASLEPRLKSSRRAAPGAELVANGDRLWGVVEIASSIPTEQLSSSDRLALSDLELDTSQRVRIEPLNADKVCVLQDDVNAVGFEPGSGKLGCWQVAEAGNGRAHGKSSRCGLEHKPLRGPVATIRTSPRIAIDWKRERSLRLPARLRDRAHLEVGSRQHRVARAQSKWRPTSPCAATPCSVDTWGG